MPKSLKELCYSDPDIAKYVNKTATKLHRVYKGVTDVEDLEHDLWIRVFEAMDRRYTPDKPLAEFVKSSVYSAYGNMLPTSGRLLQQGKLMLNQNTYSHDTSEYNNAAFTLDKNYEVVECRFTLDQIAFDLKSRYEEARYYKLGYEQLKYFRENYTTDRAAFSRKFGISTSYSQYIFDWVKKIAKKYA